MPRSAHIFGTACRCARSRGHARIAAGNCGRLLGAVSIGAICPLISDKSTSQPECSTMPPDRLGLHRRIMPSLAARIAEMEAKDEDEFDAQFSPYFILGELGEAVIFDCRGLPFDFIVDTGIAAGAEETNEITRLPFEKCYFEFHKPEMAVLVSEIDVLRCDDTRSIEESLPSRRKNHKNPILGTTVQGHVFGAWDHIPPGFIYDAYGQGAPFFEILNGFDYQAAAATYDLELPPAYRVNVKPKVLDICDFECGLDGLDFVAAKERATANVQLLRLGTTLLRGVLTLLNEKFLAQEIMPDSAERLNRRRAKDGKLPLSAPTRVLTLNLAAVRRATAETTRQPHESPALHWRRGHKRILHRGSEFEKSTWVSRCLVGDPAKGYVAHRDFRLVWHPPMVNAAEAETLH
jgi:hypothetical protein